MSYSACRPVLLVEGDGDLEAVPFLVRRIVPETERPDCMPASRPIKCGDVRKLRRVGELEKFVEYACRRTDGDSALLIVDCDDDCPKEVVGDFSRRIEPIARLAGKKVGIAFLYREFETIFLYALRELSAAHPAFAWKLDEIDLDRDWSAVRDAKGTLNSLMKAHYYKETRDQPRFVANLELGPLRDRCRSVEHLFRLLAWLVDGDSAGYVYPSSPGEV